MFQTAVLASGSKGNSILISTGKSSILLDAGLSGIKIFTALEKIGFEHSRIDALIISHEHSDHVRGAGIVCRKLNIPLYTTKPTYDICRMQLGRLPSGPVFFRNGSVFEIGDIEITPFSSSHDVVDGSNFIFTRSGNPERKLAVATDLGFGSRLMLNRLMNCSTLILESNHDLKMLIEGPYPWHLKQRIKSRQGHLSNEQAVGVLSRIIHPGLKNLCLAHLSEVNNTPDLAKSEVDLFLKKIRHELRLIIASQDEPTELIEV